MPRRRQTLLLAGLLLLFATHAIQAESFVERARKKIVLIAGKKSHGPIGNRIHDYPWSVKLLKVMLQHSNIKAQVQVEYHLDGWPKDEATLNDADTIMIISDGRDGDKYSEAPHWQSARRTEMIEKQIQRGCGCLTFHFSTFTSDQHAERILRWTGGFFDWEADGRRDWYSAIKTLDTKIQIVSPEHPITRGLQPFQMKEEFYYNLRFDPQDKQLRPLLKVPALPGREPNGNVVAWAKERADGGRGFGTTAGHFYDNWQVNNFRRLILNAIAWTAQVKIPQGGVESKFFTHDQITAALANHRKTEAPADQEEIAALLITGHEYPGHKWQETHLVLLQALEQDPRISVTVSKDIEILAHEDLSKYDVLIQNYCNWQKPAGLSTQAKKNFVKYLRQGGGLSVVHFANGAFHFSLPQAGESDWPEYRRIVRRVWNHQGTGENKSGHDRYGEFEIHVTDAPHPITEGIKKKFTTTDELYFRQNGTEPIQPLITARSQITGRDEPLAWAYRYGKGRVFQTVLGHDARALRTPEVMQLIRQGSLWAARANNLPSTKSTNLQN